MSPRNWKPIFVENSAVPKILSKIAPIQIKAITLGFIVFVDGVMSERLKRHETIHFQQFLETLFIGFVFIYFWDYFVLWSSGMDKEEAYRKIRAEKEAYRYDDEEGYLLVRKRYRWLMDT
tara:strand:+ start:2342 stop:2701 length:360 start_codon:yes stop_codon:yes gene_type:complete